MIFRSLPARFATWSNASARALQNFWAYGVSVLILVFSSYQIVSAAPPNSTVDECREIISDCKIAVPAEDIEAEKYSSAEVLAQTDYSKYVSYKIVFQGNLAASTDTEEFVTQVAQTLADERGWSRAGYVFNRVQLAKQAEFTLVLIEASLLDGIPGCSSQWSCRSGANVYINENRWNSATSAWNNAGGTLRDYRHMVANHEVGHWLGHDHYSCSDGVNNKAPVMQQQSISLQGCRFNPWPLEFEIDLVS